MYHKKQDVVREFVRGLSDEELRFLQTRLSQRLNGDLGEAATMMQGFPSLDKWLVEAASHHEFFARMDHIEAMVQGEVKKRSAAHHN
jgi:hypothetical protein